MKRFESPILQPARIGRRHFSPADAGRALVLVRRIVADVVGNYARMVDHQEAMEAAQMEGAYDRCQTIQAQLVSVAKRLQGYAAELDEVGVELKDWAVGVVDFPCMLDGREICLCWRHDEERVEHWHEVDQDDSQRQQLGEDFAENIMSASAQAD